VSLLRHAQIVSLAAKAGSGRGDRGPDASGQGQVHRKGSLGRQAGKAQVRDCLHVHDFVYDFWPDFKYDLR
jgi:hypothetical protein